MEKSPNFFTPPRIAIALAGVVIIGGLFYYFNTKNPQEENTVTSFNAKIKGASPTHVSGDYDTSIKTYGDILESAPDKISETRAKWFLAANLFRRNEGDDRAKAMGYYKGIINDYSIPAAMRARTVADMAGFVSGEDANFFRMHLSEPPYDTYLQGTDGRYDITRAVMKLYEYSDEIFPNFIAEYGAAYYRGSLSANNISVEGISEKENAQLVEKYLLLADEKMLSADLSEYLPSVIARQYLWRASMMGLTGRILGTVNREEKEVAYQLALKKATGDPNDALMRNAEMNARFFYAGFLEANFKNGSRSIDIIELLKPFALAKSDPIRHELTRSNFTSILQRAETNFSYGRAVKLAKISPEFKEFLLSVGWKL